MEFGKKPTVQRAHSDEEGGILLLLVLHWVQVETVLSVKRTALVFGRVSADSVMQELTKSST